MAGKDVGHGSFFGSFTLQCNIAGLVAFEYFFCYASQRALCQHHCTPIHKKHGLTLAILLSHVLKFYNATLNNKLPVLVAHACCSSSAHAQTHGGSGQ
jgi:alcohol dehydrogenase class IV